MILRSIEHAIASLYAADKPYWIAFVFSDTPTHALRQPYNESLLTRTCAINGQNIHFHGISPFTFIETVVAMSKQLCKTIYPEITSWIFAKLVLDTYDFLQDTTITISLEKNFNFKLIRFSILIDNRRIGELYGSPRQKNH